MVGDAVGRLNAPAWQGAGPFTEDWYVKANLPRRDASVWFRYTLLAPRIGPVFASVWAIVDLAGDVVADRATVEQDELTLDGETFRFETPHGDLTSDACGGRVGAIRWELSWEPSGYAFWHLPSWAYELPDTVSKTVTPNPDVRVEGRVEIDEAGTTLELDGARGQQGHVWGRSHADAWAWAHSNAPGGPVWEAAAARAELAGRSTPALASVLVRHEGETLAFRNVLANRARFDRDGLRFRARRLRYRVTGEVEPARLSRVRYAEPDGEPVYCHNTKRAASTLTLEKRGLRGWREVGRWEDEATTAFEIGQRDPIEGVPAVLG